MNLLRLFFRLVVLIALQVLIFNRIILFDIGIIFIYLFAIISLPLHWKTWQILLLSFCIGFVVDFFSGTYGLHMIAATAVGYARLLFARLFIRNLSKKQEDINIVIDEIPMMPFILYALCCVLLFSCLFFFFDYFQIVAIKRIMINIVSSTLFTIICFVIYRLVFVYQLNKNG